MAGARIGGADVASRSRNDWETPPWLFELLDGEFHFDVDAAAAAHNAKLPRFWTPLEDGLAQSWAGRRVFCNPPYGLQTGRWVEKAAREVSNPRWRQRAALAVLLVPANTETFWWHDWAIAYADEIRFVRRRIHFLLGGRKVRNGRPVFSSAALVFRGARRRGPCLLGSIHAPDPRSLQHGRVLQDGAA